MKWFFQYLSFPCLLLLLQACSNNSKTTTQDDLSHDTLLPPLVIPIDSLKPVIDKVLKPKVIPFPLPKSNLPKDQDSHPVVPAIRGMSRFTNFTMADGLGLNTVVCAMLDHYGNLWFGHDGAGVTRYDGKTFTTFTMAQGLANNYVYGITEDKSGNLFFFTVVSNVSRFDGKRFTLFGKTIPSLATTFNPFQNILYDRSGNLWFAGESGVTRFDGKSYEVYTTDDGLANNYVNGIRQDHSGRLWFTSGSGVSCYDGKKFTTFTKAQRQGLASDSIACITVDKSGKLWFGTSG